MRRWEIRADGALVGTIVQTGADMGNMSGEFVAGEGLTTELRELFDRKVSLASQLLYETPDDVVAAFDACEELTCPPRVTLHDEEGRARDFGLLYIEGSHAGFRLG